MKLNKRTGAVLGFLLAAGSATAATGWLTNYTWTSDTLRKEPAPVVMVTDDDDGTWTTVKTGKGISSAGGCSGSCATPIAFNGTLSAVGSSGTAIDAGATGTVRYLAFKNDSSFKIQLTEPSPGSGTLNLMGHESVCLSVDGAGQADNVTAITNCSGCGGGAVAYSGIACDD